MPRSGDGPDEGDAGGGRPSEEDGMEHVVHVTDYVFRSPKPQVSLMAVLVVGIMLAMLFDTGFPFASPDVMDIIRAWLLLFAIPPVVASLLAVPMTMAAGGILYLRRSALLALITSSIGLLVFLMARFLSLWFLIDWPVLYLFTLAMALYLWQVVLMATSHSETARSLTGSIWLPLFGYLGLVAYSGVPALPVSAGFIGFCALAVCAVEAFTHIAKVPIRKNYDVDGLYLMRNMLAHWSEGEGEGAIEMEEFFSSFSVPGRVHMDVIAFRRKGADAKEGVAGDDGEKDVGREKGKGEGKAMGLKGVIVLPGSHPGPFGRFSGSDAPEKIASLVGGVGEGKMGFVMVPHSASTHDDNPADSNQVTKLAVNVFKMVKDVQWSGGAGRMVRLRGRKDEEGRADIVAQALGDTVLLVHSASPEGRDDLDRNIASQVRRAMKPSVAHLAFVDAHNCITSDSQSVYSYSPLAKGIVSTSCRAAAGALEDKAEAVAGGAAVAGLRVGYAQDTDFEPRRDGIGPQGVQALVVETKGQRVAYLLFDGNNMRRGLRDAIVKALKTGKLVADAEVMTTDNHLLNVTMGGYNPIGLKAETGRLVKAAKRAVEKALADLEDVEVCGAGAEVDVNIFGHGATARLTATINSTIALLRTGATVSISFVVFGSIGWWFMMKGLL